MLCLFMTEQKKLISQSNSLLDRLNVSLMMEPPTGYH